ncbi:hypothetical protein SY83_04280 [Paenibacillus swuensis]|uniref:SH3b domain-containing protein n=2 Tax=Paenibacillus swuensis TaxID=1178515 RepID=A0A172TPN8_9BACL|nr:hypothetical protein SY83_04280 [Paenibacillus swuensis]
MRKIAGITLIVSCMVWNSVGVSPAVAQSGLTYTAEVHASSLNIRSEPSLRSSVKGSVKKGGVVTVTEEQHGWLKIRAGEVSGWVAGYYLSKSSGTEEASAYASGSSSGKGGVTSVAAASAQEDDAHSQAGASDLSSGAGRSGSSASDSLGSSGSSGSSAGNFAKSSSQATVIADVLRVRGGPGTHFKVQGALKEGDGVAIIQRQNDWLQIRTTGGETGWVAAQYVRSNGTAGSAGKAASSSKGLRGKVIVIDAGHGGNDPGMVGSTYETKERELNLNTAEYVRDELRAMGARVVMTRTSNEDKPGLSERVRISDEADADAFVSIHYNSSPKKVSGTLTFYYSESGDLRLAHAIESRLSDGIGLKSNGVSFGNYHILRGNETPSVLVELGFLSNPKDERIVRETSYQRKAAEAVAKGLRDYFS